MKKALLSALAFSLFVTVAQAQTTPTTSTSTTTTPTTTTPTTVTKDGGDKVITTADGMTVKTKVDEDGKMKVKGYDQAGNRMKATTKPRTAEERKEYKESRKEARKAMHGDKKMKMESSGSM